MSTGDREFLHSAIDETLTGVLELLPIKPGWFEPWRRLGPESTDEERLAVYQAIRDSGVLPEEAGFYLVSWQVDAIARRLAEAGLRHLDDRLKDVEAAHGLGEGESWEPGEAPAEYEEVLRQHRTAWDEIFTAQLDGHGERAIARLFRADPDEFARRSEAGRQYFHGPAATDGHVVPRWLESLVDVVAAAMATQGPSGPLGFLYRQEEGFWEIDVYPTPVELVGGADDGAVVSPGFSLDLEEVRSQFARVDDLGWNAWGWAEGDGPFVWIEGTYQGHDLFLRILAQAPEGEEPGAKLRLPGSKPE